MKSFNLKFRKGIDDLKSLYAFHGNSQGDHSCTNDIEVYKKSGGWMSFNFDCELTEEAIQKEVEKRKKENQNYIEELTRKEEYGSEYETSIEIAPNKELDKNTEESSYPTSSYSFFILDAEK